MVGFPYNHAMTWRVSVAVAVLAAVGAVARGIAAGPDIGQRNAALERLFTPLSVAPGTYQLTVSPQAIEALTAALKAGGGTTGAWTVALLEEHDAFGQAGI